MKIYKITVEVVETKEKKQDRRKGGDRQADVDAEILR